jgi:hypothetical protein
MRSTRVFAAGLVTAATLAGPASAMPVDPPHEPSLPPVVESAAPSDTSSGFDWSSAGIGAAGGVGAFAIALAGAAGMRRRRHANPRPLVTAERRPRSWRSARAARSHNTNPYSGHARKGDSR